MLDDLGSRKDVEHVHNILERGTSADEQLSVFQETGSLPAVVDRLMENTMESVPKNWNLEANAPA